MTSPYLFLPAPRSVAITEGIYPLTAGQLILLDGPEPQALRSAAERFQNALGWLRWEQVASRSVPAEQVGLALRVVPEEVKTAQGYRLTITPRGIQVEGHDPAGVFYGACTLVQLLGQAGRELPCLVIEDWPDIPARGVMLDISRDRVYTMETLYELVDRLAGWKINQLQLYTEHTFAYRNHPLVWAKASPVTGEEVLALDAYCRERFIELVPNQNSFGHMERWLRIPRYALLAETLDTFISPWGETKHGPFSLAPENPGSLALVSGLYDELLPHFTSKMFNVGCDETFDLGQGASKAACEQRGKGRVYFDYLMRVYQNVKQRGYTMQFWGDIIVRDHPELAAELPRDLIGLDWGYDADHPFAVEAPRFAAAGVPFYVCPGTSSWCSLAGRTDNALANLVNAAENGIQNGAIGYLNTDWGDEGHWQVPPASYLGLAAGAGYGWALEANRDLDIPAVVSRFAFDDPSGAMGRVAYDLGNVYKITGAPVGNGSALFWILQFRMADLKRYGSVELTSERILYTIDAAMAAMSGERMGRPDAALIRREFQNTARVMRHAVGRVELALHGDPGGLRRSLAADLGEFIEEYRALWLARCRPGGLADSAGRFQRALKEYRE